MAPTTGTSADCSICPVSFLCFGAGHFHAYDCDCGRLSLIQYFPGMSPSWDSEEDFDRKPVVHVVWCATPQRSGVYAHYAGCPLCKPEEWRDSNNRRVKFTDHTRTR